ncbi:MAG: transcription factor S [Candidatus Woesearchaeota archaeon]|nr:transcription factor S [Candidatus Woesearchaeota archaeon]
MFCPKCGGILMPKKDGSKKLLICKCGYKEKAEKEIKLKEPVKEKSKKVEVIERAEEESLPTTEAECPKCHHREAYYWLQQTRASDEPETRFFRCTKCKHTWREYQ